MKKYNYLEAMKEDIKNYIKTEINFADFSDREELEEYLNDELWKEDEVTGNGTEEGYNIDQETAKKYVTDNTKLCIEALTEFCTDAKTITHHFLNENWKYFDSTIRCNMLNQAIAEVLNELEEGVTA